MDERERMVLKLAVGRLLRMMSRPEQPGDVKAFYNCRAVVLDLLEPQPEYRPSWARDRLKGAQGD